MQIVGDHLQQQALTCVGEVERDLFGRSAFNRYYYATFLRVRETLARLDNKWATPPHADIPCILRGKINEHLKRERERARRADDRETQDLMRSAIQSAATLATLMDEGRAIRTVADYEPQLRVAFVTSSSFELNAVGVSRARQWLAESTRHCVLIERAWRQASA